MFQLEIFRLAQLAKPSRVRKSWSGAPRWLQMRRGYTVYRLCALTMRCSRRLLAQTRLSFMRWADDPGGQRCSEIRAPNLPSVLLGNLARMSYAPLRSPTTEALS